MVLERRGAVGLLTLSRPTAKNALCDLLMDQLNCLLDDLEADLQVKVIVITGKSSVFAAGRCRGDIPGFCGKSTGATFSNQSGTLKVKNA